MFYTVKSLLGYTGFLYSILVSVSVLHGMPSVPSTEEHQKDELNADTASRSSAPEEESKTDELKKLYTKFPDVYVNLTDEEKNTSKPAFIQKCLENEVDIFGPEAIRSFLENYPHKSGSYYHGVKLNRKLETEKEKLLNILKKACPAFSEIIATTHFYQGNAPQREVLTKYGNWPSVMLLALNKDGKEIDPEGKFASNKLYELLLNQTLTSISPSVEPKKIRLASPLFVRGSRDDMPAKKDRSMVITIPDNQTEDKLREMKKQFFFKWLLPPEFFDQMPEGEKKLIRIMLDEMSLTDILMIIFSKNDLNDFKTLYNAHLNKPEGWYFEYEIPRCDDYKNIISVLRPPFPTNEFLDEYKSILERAYYFRKELMGEPYSTKSTQHKEKTLMYNGRPYLAAHFFGYEKEAKEPNEVEKQLLDLMEHKGYEDMEVARTSYDESKDPNFLRITSQDTPKPQTSLTNPKFTLPRFIQEPLSFIKDSLSFIKDLLIDFLRYVPLVNGFLPSRK